MNTMTITTATTPRALLEQALEALEYHTQQTRPILKTEYAILVIRAALAAPDDIAAEMSTVADQYAHKLALDLECVLADYSGTWYDTAIGTLGAYRGAMNAIHERESPTFMGEPVIRPTQAAPAPDDRHAQELLAQDITIANMEARHAEELAAYELTVANLRAERDELLKLINRRKIHPHDIPLEIFIADLSTRTANVLRAEFDSFRHTAGAYDIEPPFTVRHLLMFSRQEIKKWPGIGKKGLNEIEENLRARGLQLWHAHDDRSLRLLREHKSYFVDPAKAEGTA